MSDGLTGAATMALKGQQQIDALHRAARSGDLQEVIRLLQRGIPVDAVSEQWGETALMWASGRGESDIVRLLLDRGASVNQQNESGWSALMSAASSGHAEVISVLLEHGADASLKNRDEQTALVCALESQNSAPADETPEACIARKRRYTDSIQLLTTAQPDGVAEVERWNAAREEAERWWARSFRRLYHALEKYEGAHLYREVLEPFVPHARETLEELRQFRSLNTPENPYEATHDSLAQLYALNRVNDLLLLSFQTGAGLDWDAPFQSEDYRDYMRSVGYTRLLDWQGPGVTLEEYERFFTTLGFRSFGKLDYSPFFHEIVEVIEDGTCENNVQIEHVFWPGLLFGNMLFSRAGVRVRCRPTLIKKEIAERSTIFETFWRRRRKAHDLSHGWGHNSQWGTEFRRDYYEADQCHYNVDGSYQLDERYWQRRVADEPSLEQDNLTLDERVELLTHRCFVRTPIPNCDVSPHDDRYTEQRPGDFSFSPGLLE